MTSLIGCSNYGWSQTLPQASSSRVRGGLRKARWQAAGRGKRGGVRVIYYWAREPEVILMLLVYDKSERDDLSPQQKKVLGALVREEFK